jgi:hypothetical protein
LSKNGWGYEKILAVITLLTNDFTYSPQANTLEGLCGFFFL